MSTEFSFSLSLAAFDLLWDQLGLGLPAPIFEVPSVGETMEDRARLRGIVYGDLTNRNLAFRGRLVAEVEEALVTLARFRTAMEVVGYLDDGEKLCARGAHNGRTGVLAKKDEQTITFDVITPDALVPAMVGLIGTAQPGSGQSVTFPEANPEAERQAELRRRRQPDADEGFGGVFQPARPQQTGYDLQRRSASTIWDKPRLRMGFFTVYGHDRQGRQQMAPALLWFDTEDGRYLGHSRPGQDGQTWTTYAPADNGRIAQQLIGLIASMNQ